MAMWNSRHYLTYKRYTSFARYAYHHFQDPVLSSSFEGVDISFGHDYSESLQVSNNANAEGWSVTVPGKYCFYAIKDSHHAFAKAFKARKTLYIVGGCCPHSWNYWTDVASIQFVPNPSNPEELVWEGFLKPTWDEHREEPNKFKILTAQDWNSETFHPYVADAPLLGTSYFRSSGGGDVNGLYPRLPIIVLL